MTRASADILKEIDYYLIIRDYMNNKAVQDYQMESALIRLVFAKLDSLQEEIRQDRQYYKFLWTEYQFENKK